MIRLLILPLVALAALTSACGPAPAPKPLPGGPPPEYEAPRAFNPNALENGPGKPVDTGPQRPAPTGVNPTTPAPAGPPSPTPQ